MRQRRDRPAHWGRGRGGPRPFSSPRPIMDNQPLSNGFTMRDEARHTASHLTTWGRDARLREKPIVFVSAGYIQPLKDLNALDETQTLEGAGDASVESTSRPAETVSAAQVAAMSYHDQPTHVISPSEDRPQAGRQPFTITGQASQPRLTKKYETESQADIRRAEASKTDQDAPGATQVSTSAEPRPLFCIDLKGDSSLRDKRHPPTQIPNSSLPSSDPDSGEDVILFKGKKWHAAQRAQAKTQPKTMPKPKPKLQPKPPAATAPALNMADMQEQIRVLEASMCVQTQSSESSLAHEATTGRTQLNAQIQQSHTATVTNAGEEIEDDLLDRVISSLDQPDTFMSYAGGEPGSNDRVAEISPEADDSASDVDANGPGESRDSEEEDEDDDEDNQLSEGAMDADLDDEAIAALLSTRMSEHFDMPPTVSKKKGRRSKHPPTFNVSDSELEAALQSTWQNDRQRKKQRKMEREVLRQQGLLNKKANPDDLRLKYPEGMKVDEVKAELRDFILATTESLQFPPMDKHARRTLHELATKFNIKSKSTGNGDERRPILYRTKRTVRYSANRSGELAGHIEAASVRIYRKTFHRPDKMGGRKTGGAGKGGGSGGMTYREGEIVGASAPQIGEGNKGRTMLEKMGWTKGTALGTDDNKGILEPVAQVVKRSKAGLG